MGSQIKHQRAIGSAKTAMAATAHHQGNALPPCLLNRLNNLSDITGLQHQLGIARCSIAVKELALEVVVVVVVSRLFVCWSKSIKMGSKLINSDITGIKLAEIDAPNPLPMLPMASTAAWNGRSEQISDQVKISKKHVAFSCLQRSKLAGA